ncbi:MAG: GNAT family N-acetyltransferase [Anaerolineae bacterium]|nr:GNAT family N-acetyltransferase [Anaerolineae bacterium]
MNVHLRPAIVEDAPGIARLKQVVWADEVSESDRVARVIVSGKHSTLVAECDGEMIGFVDLFMTRSITNEARWEVDLLAVHPDCRGRGVGTALVQASTQAGQSLGATLARGLVQTQNIASQKAFERCGYIRDREAHILCVAGRPGTSDSDDGAGAIRIPVQTFNYTGLWLEGVLNPSVFAAARAALHIAPGNYELAGTLIPASNQALLDMAAESGYDHIAEFSWWQQSFR